MSKPGILFIGGDMRFSYATDILTDKGYTADCFLVPSHTSADTSVNALKKKIHSSEILVVPIPFTKDNLHLNTTGEFADTKIKISDFFSYISKKNIMVGTGIKNDILSSLNSTGIRYIDICKDKSFTYKNSMLTAEGLLKDIIADTPFSINGSKTLLLGFGSLGQAIAPLMRALSSDVTIYNRNPYYDCIAVTSGFKTINKLKADVSLSDFNIIINTIPSIIFDNSHYRYVNDGVYFYETASGNGGFSPEIYTLAGNRFKKLPGIPGKTAPKTAAEAISKIIEEVCNES